MTPKPRISIRLRPVFRCTSARRLFFFLTLTLASAISAQVNELTAKALFLEAAVRFITWPADQDGKTVQRAFNVGLFDNDPLVPYLADAFSRKNIRNHPVRFRVVELPMTTLDSCDILFIPGTSAARLDRILEETRGKPVLTVSDFPGFASRGVMLVVSVENQRIRCFVNEAAVNRARLAVSYHLLQKSTITAPAKRSK